MKKDMLLRLAYRALLQSPLNDRGKVKKIYNGYIASFGAGVVQSGLLATLAIFHHNTDSGEAPKKPLMDALLSILKEHHAGLPAIEPQDTLFLYAVRHADHLPLIQRRVTEAAVALKLAIRTFELQ